MSCRAARVAARPGRTSSAPASRAIVARAVAPPRRPPCASPATLGEFITRKIENLEDIVTETPVPNLGLISGAYDFLGAANPKYAQKIRLLRKIQSLDYDFVLLDLGAG